MIDKRSQVPINKTTPKNILLNQLLSTSLIENNEHNFKSFEKYRDYRQQQFVSGIAFSVYFCSNSEDLYLLRFIQ